LSRPPINDFATQNGVDLGPSPGGAKPAQIQRTRLDRHVVLDRTRLSDQIKVTTQARAAFFFTRHDVDGGLGKLLAFAGKGRELPKFGTAAYVAAVPSRCVLSFLNI
jgi:hypothetical protein